MNSPVKELLAQLRAISPFAERVGIDWVNRYVNELRAYDYVQDASDENKNYAAWAQKKTIHSAVKEILKDTKPEVIDVRLGQERHWRFFILKDKGNK